MPNRLVAASAWKPARAGRLVTFSAPAAGPAAPLLVWPDRGLGVLDASLRAFYDAIAEAMKEPTYPHGLATRQWHPWSQARLDRDEGFVYLSGPARADRTATGYRPAATVAVAVADLRHLRIRIAAYLGSRGRL